AQLAQPVKIALPASDARVFNSSGPTAPGRSALSTPVIVHSSTRPKRNFSRRTIVAGLCGFALLGSGSAALLLEHLLTRSAGAPGHTAHHTPGPTSTPTP